VTPEPITVDIIEADLDGAPVPEYDLHAACNLCGASIAHSRQARATHHAFHIVLWADATMTRRVLTALTEQAQHTDPEASPS